MEADRVEMEDQVLMETVERPVEREGLDQEVCLDWKVCLDNRVHPEKTVDKETKVWTDQLA